MPRPCSGAGPFGRGCVAIRLWGDADVLTLEGLRQRRREILRVARKRRAQRIAVFGSVARGEARPDSDLDLLVDFEPGTSLLDQVAVPIADAALGAAEQDVRASAGDAWAYGLAVGPVGCGQDRQGCGGA